jgi:hypothetical protein
MSNFPIIIIALLATVALFAAFVTRSRQDRARVSSKQSRYNQSAEKMAKNAVGYSSSDDEEDPNVIADADAAADAAAAAAADAATAAVAAKRAADAAYGGFDPDFTFANNHTGSDDEDDEDDDINLIRQPNPGNLIRDTHVLGNLIRDTHVLKT